MIFKLQPICSGSASGKQRIEVRNNYNELRGWIQVTEVDWTPILGGGTRFIAQQCSEGNYDMQIFGCMQEALHFLGFNDKEIDSAHWPEGIYNEFAWEDHLHQFPIVVTDHDRLNMLVGRTFRVIEQHGVLKVIVK